MTRVITHLDQLGEQARKLRQDIADATDAVADTREELKGYNERRREQSAKLKEILSPIVAELQAGGTVNGVKGLHAWAAWYNPTAKDGKNAARQITRIVNSPERGEKQGDIKSPKALTVKEGQIITFFDFLDENDQPIKVTFKITALPAGISELWGDKNDRTKRFSTIGIELVEAPVKAEPKAPKKRQPIMHIHDERSALTLCEVFYSRKHGISKHYKKAGVANCKKCIAIANEKGLPTTLTKAEVTPVKKISHKETVEAIEEVLSQFPRTRDEFIAAGCTDPDNGNACQWNLNLFNEAANAHPEWRKEPVRKTRRTLESYLTTQLITEKTPTESETSEEPTEEPTSDKVRIRLSEAQAREIRAVGVPDTAVLMSKTLMFHSDYEENAKALVLALEQRIETLNREAAALIDANRDLYFESDSGASDAAREIKGQVAKLHGAATACKGAIRPITFGAEDDEQNILDWYEKRERIRDEEESARRKAESDKWLADFDARREKAEAGWENETPTMWKNEDGRTIKKLRANYKLGLNQRYEVSDSEGVIGTFSFGDSPWDGLMKAMETKREMKPAREGLITGAKAKALTAQVLESL